MAKLTEAQRSMLEYLASHGPVQTRVGSTLRMLKTLERLGLVAFDTTKRHFHLTDTGRAALKDLCL